ncbi:MAG: TIGR04076 family protein [Xanthomonadales bacterium]|nr:TIGR04076 family protein [Gammaproteobacteria bacterium]NNE06435.1 TIGR04076 family protein [Xanthomonadales bacterium]NNL95839.1 TIGR04076 family protein [Xanthomonadales bacterium]
MPADEFELWDLRVEVVGEASEMVCSHHPGDYFEVSGENFSLPEGQSFSIYALAAILPLLPAKQRVTDGNDWMTTDADVACPDPNCGARFRIRRTRKRTFSHAETTVVPLRPN